MTANGLCPPHRLLPPSPLHIPATVSTTHSSRLDHCYQETFLDWLRTLGLSEEGV